MKTAASLLNATQYLDGSPVYYGDPTRLYSSEILCSVELSIVRAPEGSQHLTKSDDQLIAAMRKLKFGQIGALKSDINISSSEVLCQIVVPIDFEDVLRVKDNLKALFTFSQFQSSKIITVDGKSMTVEAAKAIIAKHRENNRDIRMKWTTKVKSLKSRGASAEEILEQKAAAHTDYISVSEYAMSIGVSMTHYVHKPDLKGTVIANLTEEQYKAFNYAEGAVRKVATLKDPIISIPITSLKDREDLIAFTRQLIEKDNLLHIHEHAEQLIIEGSPVNNQTIDFAKLRKHDQDV
jgi:hypothetical protein